MLLFRKRLGMGAHIFPQIADSSNACRHGPQRKCSWRDLAGFQLLPSAGSRDRRTRLGTNGVCGGERRTVAISARVHQNAAGAISLIEFLREAGWMTAHQY